MSSKHTAAEIIETTCRVLRVSYTDLIGSGRSPSEVQARRIVALLCRRHTIASYTEIAQAFHKKSHSIVVEWFHKAQQLARDDPEFTKAVKRVESGLVKPRRRRWAT